MFDLARWAGLDDSGMERPQIVSVGQGVQACEVVCGIAPSLISIIGATDRVEAEGALSPFLGPAYATTRGMAREFAMARWLATAASNLTGGAAT